MLESRDNAATNKIIILFLIILDAQSGFNSFPFPLCLNLIHSHCVSIIFSHACIIAELDRFLNNDLTISGDIFVHDWRFPHFQHTPVILMVITIWSIAIHDDISKVCEHFPLEWFGKTSAIMSCV